MQEYLGRSGARTTSRFGINVVERISRLLVTDGMGSTLRAEWRLVFSGFCRQQIRLLQRAKEMIDGTGLAPKRVPLKVLLPIFENASIEDDDDLQDRWAALLASNAAGKYVSTVFP
jgi:hypothetical protein